MLNAQSSLELPALKARVRFLTAQETTSLTESVRRRNVFARHSWEKNFYIQRIGELSNTTILEVLRPGDPDDMLLEAQATAGLLERFAVLSSTFAVSRPDFHRVLAIRPDRSSSVDFTFGRQFYYLRSTANPAPVAKGIAIDDRFKRRFDRCGFPNLLLVVCASKKEIARRLEIASRWLFESRQEPSMPAAIVKTAIALEALLIANESEPLTRALSERAAFLLSRDARTRRDISRNIRKFYTARSAVVHGSRRLKSVSPKLLEGMDRLILLLCLKMAANIDGWSSMDALTGWLEDQKWGAHAAAVIQPFPGQYLNSVLRLFGQASGQTDHA